MTREGAYSSGRNHRPLGADGFTLIELMIVAAVLAIIVAIALPSFLETIQRSRRSDAQIALVELAALQDKFRNDNMTYTTIIGALPYPAVSPEGYYQLSIFNTTNATFYQVQATPQGTQATDIDCSVFSLTSTNVKAVVDGNGADTTNRCWR